MNVEEIQQRIDAMPARMSAKGLKFPDARFALSANEAAFISLTWSRPKHGTDDSYKIFRINGTIADAVTEADGFIANLPTAEETKQREFMSALGGIIELGRENGIEVAYVNPLVETMKRLSENVLTHQSASSP